MWAAARLLSHSTSSAAGIEISLRCLAQQLRPFATESTNRYCICIVGSGPAGFYTADRLLKTFGERCQVDILEQLPTPFGLVRSGVAPDHPETKNVVNHFTDVAADPRCRYFGNVTVERDVSVDQLRSTYDAVVLAYGAESDRRLNIPGEELHGVLSAREFVWWYNGHPFVPGDLLDLGRVKSAVVVGIGNVALDCARILLSSPDQIQQTDIAEHALQQLRHSTIDHIHLVARRGPVQMACTPKELREILRIAGPNLHIDPQLLQPTPADQKEMAASRIRRRLHEVLSKAAAQANPRPGAKQLHFHFYQTPTAFSSEPHGSVAGVSIVTSRGTPPGMTQPNGRRADQHAHIPAQLVLKSIGYKAIPLAGVAFEDNHGIIPNRDGRVLDDHGNADAGLYVSGWLRRGPTGIIGTNIPDAEIVAEAVAADLSTVQPKAMQANLEDVLKAAGVPVFTFEDWKALDNEEVRRGQLVGKPREKVVSVQDMLAMRSSAQR